jgi:hypothetical protein
VHKIKTGKLILAQFLFILQYILGYTAVQTAQIVAGDISRRKKVKEKRPSPLLFTLLLVFIYQL